MGITVERVAGPDRSGTSVALATKELADYGFIGAHFDLATGGSFPDALAGGPHAGARRPR